MSHAKNFVHAWDKGVNRGRAADFILKIGGEFFGFFDDLLAFFVVGIPSILVLGRGLLAEGGKSDLREAVFDNLVACFELRLFPEAERLGGGFESGGNRGDMVVG